MKTFFLALILGIFIGSIVTHYFADPQAYQNLQEAKASLFGEEPEETETSEPSATNEESEPARFEVGSGDLEDEQGPTDSSPHPIPLPKPATKPEATAPSESAPSAPTEETEPSPTPDAAEAVSPETETKAPEKPKSRSEELIEEGVKKTEEIAKTVSEKAKEVAEEAKPLIEDGIDLTIAAGIRAQYKLERRLDSDAIKISVKDQIVTLSGNVKSEDAKKLAIEIAVFTKGVNGVEETLSIVE